MLALATERLTPASVVLDVGCRDATHLIELVRATGAIGVGIDPVSRLVEQARKAVSEAGLDSRVQIVEGVMQDIPYPDASFDLVWCRDVIEVVEGLAAGIAEIARVLRPAGHLIVFTVFATDRLEPKEAALLLGQSLAVVPASLVDEKVEDAFSRAGLAIAVKDVIGTQWREYAEERTQPVSRDLCDSRDSAVSETGSSRRLARRSTGTSSRIFTGSSISSWGSSSPRSTCFASNRPLLLGFVRTRTRRCSARAP